MIPPIHHRHHFFLLKFNSLVVPYLARLLYVHVHVLSDIILSLDYGLLFFWRSLFFPLDYSIARSHHTISVLRSVPFRRHRHLRVLFYVQSIVTRAHLSLL
jgi:hypothetical protein